MSRAINFAYRNLHFPLRPAPACAHRTEVCWHCCPPGPVKNTKEINGFRTSPVWNPTSASVFNIEHEIIQPKPYHWNVYFARFLKGFRLMVRFWAPAKSWSPWVSGRQRRSKGDRSETQGFPMVFASPPCGIQLSRHCIFLIVRLPHGTLPLKCWFLQCF